MTAKKEALAVGKESDSNGFPLIRRLFVTTRSRVYAWDANGVSECFRSGSAGILVARRVGPDGHLLAIADAEMVVLHDTTKEMDRSYKLKSADVLCQQSVRPPSIAANVWSGSRPTPSLCCGISAAFFHDIPSNLGTGVFVDTGAPP